MHQRFLGRPEADLLGGSVGAEPPQDKAKKQKSKLFGGCVWEVKLYLLICCVIGPAVLNLQCSLIFKFLRPFGEGLVFQDISSGTCCY